MKSELKIAIVTSSRADWGLLLPLARALRERGVEPIVIATYAHLFNELGNTLKELIEDGFTPKMTVPARMKNSEALADTTTGFTKAFNYLKPDCVVILGDRFEMLGVAAAALLEQIPVTHIAGGTVSEGAIDDSVRNAITQLASQHFPETFRCAERLEQMGVKKEDITVAGALGVYNALNNPLMNQNEIEESLQFEIGDRLLLGTFHPATIASLSPLEQMRIWLDGVKLALDRLPDLKVILTYPNSDTDPTALLMLMYQLEMENRERVKIIDSLGRLRYLSVAKLASVVAGNSSSGIVEIPSVGTPVIDVGSRQQGRERSEAVIHADLDAKSIADAIEEALSETMQQKAASTPNPYHRENTPAVIADKIISMFTKK